MMNSSKSKAKKSKLEIQTNKYLKQAFVIQTIVCLTGAIFSTLWDRFIGNYSNPYYLELDSYWKLDDYGHPIERVTGYPSIAYTIPVKIGQWYLSMMNFVAISLLVCLETSKFF